jgi:hypothetical protein
MKTPCTNCSISAWHCPRCDAAVCADHMAMYRQECVDCALAYYDSLDRVNLRAWFVVGFALMWVPYFALSSHLPSWSARSGGYRAITTGVPALDIVIMVTITAVFAGKAMMTLRKWMHHRSFVTRELARAKLVR